MASARSSSCAFPSWPNRSSLFSDSDSGSGASAYLSDEDLFPTSPYPTSTPSSSSAEAIIDDDELAALPLPAGASNGLTTEQQIHMINDAAADQERRLQQLVNMHAQVRAQQALRAAQLAAEQKSGTAKRRKRRVVTDKKRRTTSSSTTSSSGSSRSSTKSSTWSGWIGEKEKKKVTDIFEVSEWFGHQLSIIFFFFLLHSDVWLLINQVQMRIMEIFAPQVQTTQEEKDEEGKKKILIIIIVT